MHNSNILFYQCHTTEYSSTVLVTLPVLVACAPPPQQNKQKERSIGDPMISLDRIAPGIYCNILCFWFCGSHLAITGLCVLELL